MRIAIQQASAYEQLQAELAKCKQAEAALTQSEARFQAFMNHSPTASWISDQNGRVVYLSQNYLTTFQLQGETVEDWIGKTVFDMYAAEIAEQFVDNLRLVVQTQQILEVIEQAPRPDGTLGYFLVYKFPLPQTTQQCLIGGIAVDITERVLAEQALQQLNQQLEIRVEQRTAALKDSERRYATLTEAAPVGIFRLDAASQCIYVNDSWGKITGRPTQAALGMGWLQALHPEDRHRLLMEWSEGFWQIRQEVRYLHPNGSTWFYLQVLPESNPSGTIIGYIGTLTDITERKQAESALRESERRYATLAEAAPVAIFRLDAVGQCIYLLATSAKWECNPSSIPQVLEL